jgi:hypothetical protein
MEACFGNLLALQGSLMGCNIVSNSLGGAFPFLVVLVLRYKLSLCHTTIKPDLLGFPGIGVFACGLRDHEVRIIWYHS